MKNLNMVIMFATSLEVVVLKIQIHAPVLDNPRPLTCSKIVLLHLLNGIWVIL